MAAFCMAVDGKYRKTLAGDLEHMEFVLDASTDVAGLPTNTEAKLLYGELVGPCAPGSAAVVPSEGAVYMLDCSGAWSKL